MIPGNVTQHAPARGGIARTLYLQVLVGLALGILLGWIWPSAGADMKPFGDGFVKLVRMMIAPVVFCTIVSGISSLSDTREIGTTLAKSMALFYVLTILALAIGLVSVVVIGPGDGMHVAVASLDKSVAAGFSRQAAPVGFADFILHLIPNSFFGAFAEGEVLPVLLIAVLVGFGLTRVGEAGLAFKRGVDSFSHVLFAGFAYIMRLAPLGAFGAMAFTVGRYGIASIGSLGLLIATFYVACIGFVLVVLGGLARLHGFSILKLMRYFREELLIVLGTASTEPVLPRVLQKLEALGCKRGVVGLVLPTGYSFNLDGTAIYLTLASMFIAQACDIHLSFGRIMVLLGVMLLTSKGAAGVSGSGFVALVATLTVMPDLPVAGVALLVGVDRFMSEARALTSLVSNCVASVVVAMWEGACDRDVLARELDQNYNQTEAALEAGKLA